MKKLIKKVKDCINPSFLNTPSDMWRVKKFKMREVAEIAISLEIPFRQRSGLKEKLGSLAEKYAREIILKKQAELLVFLKLTREPGRGIIENPYSGYSFSNHCPIQSRWVVMPND